MLGINLYVYVGSYCGSQISYFFLLTVLNCTQRFGLCRFMTSLCLSVGMMKR